jgi:hypothetical protein
VRSRHLAESVCESAVVENPRRGITHLLHQPPDRASARVGAVRTQPKLRHARAGNRRQRAVDDPDHFSERDTVGRARQAIAAAASAPAFENAVFAQFQQGRLQELARDVFRVGDAGNMQRLAGPGIGQDQQRAKRVFGLLRQLYPFAVQLVESSVLLGDDHRRGIRVPACRRNAVPQEG